MSGRFSLVFSVTKARVRQFRCPRAGRLRPSIYRRFFRAYARSTDKPLCPNSSFPFFFSLRRILRNFCNPCPSSFCWISFLSDNQRALDVFGYLNKNTKIVNAPVAMVRRRLFFILRIFRDEFFYRPVVSCLRRRRKTAGRQFLSLQMIP